MNNIKKNSDKPSGISEKIINIITIINEIEKHDAYPSIEFLAKLCEVSKRTIYRYLNIINSVIPVVFDKYKNGYKFELKYFRKCYGLSDVEVAIFAVMSDLLGQIGEPLRSEFQSTIKRFTSSDNNSAMIKVSNSELAIEIDEAKFKTIFQSIANNKKVLLKYRSADERITERKVDPITLFFHEGIWFLYGYCNYRCDLRWFALDRMISVTSLNEHFTPQEKDTIDERFRKSFKFWQSDNEILVRVVFSKEIANIIGRKKQWHNSEIRKVLDDGSIELALKVSQIEEVKWWLYSWIPHVTVLEPESLKNEMIGELKLALKSWE